MVNVGPLELLLVAVIALIVLGPQRLPEVARSLGRGMREFRTAISSVGPDEDDEDEDDAVDEDDAEEEDEEPDPEAYQKDAESSDASSSSSGLV